MSNVIDSPATITAEEVERNLTENPEQMSQNWWGFDRMDGWLFGIMVVVTLTVNHVYGTLNAVIPVLVLIGGFWRWEFGRTYNQILWWFWSVVIVLNRGVIYEAHPATARALKSKLLPRPFPFSLYEVRSEYGNIGMAYNESTRQDTLVITAEGSKFLGENLAQMNDFIAMLSQSIKKVVSLGGSNVGIAFVAHKRPLNLWKITRSYHVNMHPDVVFPKVLQENIPESEWTARDHRMVALHRINVVELPATVSEYGKDFAMAMVLTIQRPRLNPFDSRRKRMAKVNEADIRKATQVKVVQAALDELARLGVSQPKVLDLAGLQTYFRGLWDIRSVDKFHDWSANASPGDITESDRHWPEHIMRAKSDHLIVDETTEEGETVGNFHAFILLKSNPKKTLPDYNLNLYVVNEVPYIAVSSVGVPVSYKLSYEALKRGVPMREAVLDKLGFTTSHPEMEMASERLRARQWQLATSRFTDKRAVLIMVSATTEAELDRCVDEAIRHYKLNNFSPKLIKKRARYNAALIAAAGVPVL